MTPARLPRAVRNSNPGNIRFVASNHWIGQDNPAGDDCGYCRFSEPKFGFRALICLLRNYGKRHGLETLAAMVPRFAPPGDNNNDSAYIKHLEDMTGRDRRTLLDFDDEDEMKGLARAIAVHEAGGWFFDTEKDLNAGAALAFGA